MRRATTVLAAGILAVLLSACGTNNIVDSGSFTTPVVAAPMQTATATKASIATATAIPATATLAR